MKIPIVVPALLTVAMGAAIPDNTADNRVSCNEGEVYVVELGDRTVERFHYPAYGTPVGCRPDKRQLLSKRDGFDTNVNVDEGSVSAVWYKWEFDDPEHPPTFTELWDAISGECLPNVCREGTQVCGDLNTGNYEIQSTQLCINARANFPDADMAGPYFAAARQAFDRALTVTNGNGVIVDNGPEYIYINAPRGDGSGTFLEITFSIGAENVACPDWLNAINSVGSLVPEYGTIFGAMGAVCGSIG